MPVSRASWPLKMASDQGSVKRARLERRDRLEVGEVHLAHHALVPGRLGDGLEAHAAPPAWQPAAGAGRRGVASGARP